MPPWEIRKFIRLRLLAFAKYNYWVKIGKIGNYCPTQHTLCAKHRASTLIVILSVSAFG